MQPRKNNEFCLDNFRRFDPDSLDLSEELKTGDEQDMFSSFASVSLKQ